MLLAACGSPLREMEMPAESAPPPQAAPPVVEVDLSVDDALAATEACFDGEIGNLPLTDEIYEEARSQVVTRRTARRLAQGTVIRSCPAIETMLGVGRDALFSAWLEFELCLIAAYEDPDADRDTAVVRVQPIGDGDEFDAQGTIAADCDV